LKAALKALITLESSKKLFKKADNTKKPDENFQAIMEISRRCAALPTQDYRSENEILGYNEIGSFCIFSKFGGKNLTGFQNLSGLGKFTHTF